MSIFKKVDFTQVHDMVTCCVLDCLIKNVQQFGQVNYILLICLFTTMLILCDLICNHAIYRTRENFGVGKIVNLANRMPFTNFLPAKHFFCNQL